MHQIPFDEPSTFLLSGDEDGIEGQHSYEADGRLNLIITCCRLFSSEYPKNPSLGSGMCSAGGLVEPVGGSIMAGI